jgi:hypothetical protein
MQLNDVFHLPHHPSLGAGNLGPDVILVGSVAVDLGEKEGT